ncbi:MAG: U32 family peptidase, partial [Actinobacteria bacterium]|nr:U32 family peptidase [Actinomycetota bacterium]
MPELLAPAGSEEALKAALAAGADAVYLGLDRWSARAFAGNFDAPGLLRAIDMAHLWGARVHLTLNTLLKETEIEPALAALEAPYRAGLDAVLVADLGLAAAVRERFPALALHASTQLGSHSSAQLALLAQLGFERAVLARELSLEEIAALDPHGLALEVFVHGALCYGYSGLCLLSSMAGGRSGNRGRCAQACRLRYRLSETGSGEAVPAGGAGSEVVSGGEALARPRSAGHGRDDDRGRRSLQGRLLSTSDLAAIERLPDLIAGGVRAFKIEGRMKDAGYVATAVAVYREALDAALDDPASYSVRAEWRERLEESFSRSFTTAHLDGHHDQVRSGGRSGHRGIAVGRVASLDEAAGLASVRLSRPVAAGDRLTIYTAGGQTPPQAVPAAAQDRVQLPVPPGVSVKDRVFRVASAVLAEEARRIVTGRRVARPLPIAVRVTGRLGEPAVMIVRQVSSAAATPTAATTVTTAPTKEPGASTVAEEDPSSAVTVRSRRLLETAQKAPLGRARVREAVASLGGTPYVLADFTYEMPDASFLPVGELKDMRRRALTELDERRLKALRREPAPVATTPGGLPGSGPEAGPGTETSRPSVRPSDRLRGPSEGLRSDQRATADRRGSCDSVTSPAEGALVDPAVVLRLRPHDRPLPAPGVTAVCFDLHVGDEPAVIGRACASALKAGLAVRCRPPQILFAADMSWWRSVARLPWT